MNKHIVARTIWHIGNLAFCAGFGLLFFAPALGVTVFSVGALVMFLASALAKDAAQEGLAAPQTNEKVESTWTH